MTTTVPCPHNEAGCPGPTGYDVNDFSSEICAECEVEAICSEPPEPIEVNKHGRVVCDYAGCSRPSTRSARCHLHQDLNEDGPWS